MEPSCVRQDLIPGTSRLFSDYIYNFTAVSRFYPAGNPDLDNIAAAAASTRFPDDRRAAIVAALSEQNANAPALGKLAQKGTVAVVTGQQVGLFLGPAYTIFKALTAVKIARHLESQEIPAVPVFWLATEDHDLAEVDHAWVFDQKNTPAKISASFLVATGGPVGTTLLADLPIDELRAALGDLPFADQTIERLTTFYRPGVTLGNAFAGFLKELLADYGLLFLDPLAPSIRHLAAPLLSRAAVQSPALVQALRDRSSDLEAAGYHAQVLVEKNASLLFLLSGSKRSAMRWQDGRIVSREGDFSIEDLAGLAERLSPNALLRSVMQDYLLPTAAYVAGPAEIAYFAQSSALYESLGMRMPVIYPRNSMTLLDQRAVKLMTRYKLALPDLLVPQEKVRGRIAAHLVPQDLGREFENLTQSVEASLKSLRSDLHKFDPTLEAAAHKSSAKILYQFQKLQAKTARETLRRDEKASADTDYLLNLVYPHKHLQERLYSVTGFLAKYGFDLPARIYDEIQLSCPDHMLRVI